MSTSTSTNQQQEASRKKPVIPASIRFHHNGIVVAKGVLEYIDNVYSIVTLKVVSQDLTNLPESFRELKAGQQFSKAHEILEKLYPKKNKNPVTTWAGRVSVKVGGQWKMIENGNRKPKKKSGDDIDLNEPAVVTKKRFSRKELALTAFNEKSKEDFSDLLRKDTQTNNNLSKNVSRDENSDEGDSDSEERFAIGPSSSSGDHDGTTAPPSTIPIPTGIRFLKDRTMVAEGELLFVDSQYSVVLLSNVVDRKDIAPQVKKLKGVTLSRIGLFLDLLYPKKGKASNRWAGRVEIKIDDKWEMLKYKDPGQTTECLTREYLISHCVNTGKREQFNHLKLDSISKKRNRRDNEDDDGNESDNTDKSYVEPTPKKSRIGEASDSPSTVETRATRNNATTPESKPQSSTSSITNAIDEQFRSLVSVIDNQIAEETKKMEEAKVEYHKLRDNVNALKRRREALDQFYQIQ